MLVERAEADAAPAANRSDRRGCVAWRNNAAISGPAPSGWAAGARNRAVGTEISARRCGAAGCRIGAMPAASAASAGIRLRLGDRRGGHAPARSRHDRRFRGPRAVNGVACGGYHIPCEPGDSGGTAGSDLTNRPAGAPD